MIRVLLIDDHAAFREPLSFMFDREPELEVVGQAGSLVEARNMLGLDVDVAAIDLDLSDGDGTQLIGESHRANPQATALVLTASAERGRRARVVDAGAAGVLHKSVYTRDVIDVIRQLEAGEALLTADEVGAMLRLADQQRAHGKEARQAVGSLTPREREVMAERLYISVGTARDHFARILNKLGVHSRLQALVFASRRLGIVEID